LLATYVAVVEYRPILSVNIDTITHVHVRARACAYVAVRSRTTQQSCPHYSSTC